MPSIMTTPGLTQPISNGTIFNTADGTTAKTLFTGSTGPYRCTGIIVTSTDTVAVVMDLILHQGTTNTLLGSVSIPAGTGSAGTKGIDLLASCMPADISGIDLAQTAQLYAGCEAAISATKQIAVTFAGGLY